MAKHGDIIKITFVENEHAHGRQDDDDALVPVVNSATTGAGLMDKHEDFLFRFDVDAFESLKNKGVQNLNVRV